MSNLEHARMLMWIACAVLLASLSACRKAPDNATPPAEHADDHGPGTSETTAPTNRVDIPSPVRQNLGITFAKAERRSVSHTLRIPGAFELQPGALREYRTPAAGIVEPAVTQFDRVEIGTVLYRLDSPRWRELQEGLATADAAIDQARARAISMGPLRAAHRRHEASLSSKVDLWTARVAQLRALREAGGGSAKDLVEAEGALNATQAELADTMEKDAELESRELEGEAELRAAITRRALLLSTAATMTGLSPDDLAAAVVAADVVNSANAKPRWSTIDRLEIRAQSPGVVESLQVAGGGGGQVDASGLVLTVIQPERVRFRAKGLQSDLPRLRPGLPAMIVPPAGSSSTQTGISAELSIGLRADAEERTVDLLATPGHAAEPWARDGVSGFLEITLTGGTVELAVPTSCIVRDGALPVLFRRDPANPDKAIRLEADVGISDGRWTVIKSGLREGDEIVLDGVYPLLLATSGSAPKGGHFHSDGTFHEGKD